MTSEQLVERLREEWMTKSRSSFDCAQCGVEANLIDEVITHIDAQDAECSRLQEALSAAETRISETRKKALEALGALCDKDAAYYGNEIHITCNSHSDAIQRMRVAREALAAIRSLSADEAQP